MDVHKVFNVLVLIILLLIPISFSQQKGVEIKPIPQSQLKPSSIQLASNWVISHIWVIVLFLAIGLGIFLFLYIWKKTTAKIDPFYQDWKRTKDLCKMNKRWSIKNVYRVSGVTGLAWLGDYEGDCILEDGTINVMWSNWKWGIIGKIIRWVFFPLRPLLSMVMKEYSILKAPYSEKELLSIEVKKDENGNPVLNDKKKPIIEKKYGDKTIDYVTFDNSGNVLIKAVSLSKSKNFFCPVVSNERGEVVDTRLAIFEKEQGSALIDGLYNLTVDFANIMRERIAIEPKVRYQQKVEGTEVREE